eukprot:1144574-Pelagomonas_calceolata.AAC.1
MHQSENRGISLCMDTPPFLPFPLILLGQATHHLKPLVLGGQEQRPGAAAGLARRLQAGANGNGVHEEHADRLDKQTQPSWLECWQAGQASTAYMRSMLTGGAKERWRPGKADLTRSLQEEGRSVQGSREVQQRGITRRQ